MSDKPVNVVSIESLQKAVAKRKEIPLRDHFEPEIGAYFRIKPLSGKDIEKIANHASGDSSRYNEYLATFAVADPPIGPGEWELLGQLSPLVRTRLITAILEHSGLTDTAVEESKNDSGEAGN